jgi:hypothetical protein
MGEGYALPTVFASPTFAVSALRFPNDAFRWLFAVESE